MAGYANRTILLSFPELSEEGDNVHVTIRNPKTMPAQDLMADTPADPNDQQAAFKAGLVVLARLVVAWHVYDATDDSPEQAPLPLPATPDLVAKLPLEIQNSMAAALTGVTGAGA